METETPTQPGQLAGCTILAVDDEEQVLRLIQQAFGEANVVLTALTGAEGLTILEKETVDVVLLDLRMGGVMNGVQVLEVIKKRQPDLSVVIHSAYLTQNMPELASADDFIVKPASISQLSGTLLFYANVTRLKRMRSEPG